MAGGVESITGLSRGEPAQFDENPRLLEDKPDVFMAMGNTAEVVARRYQVSREAQDAYALQSQQRYAAAVEAGHIGEEIAPMTVQWSKVVDKETNMTSSTAPGSHSGLRSSSASIQCATKSSERVKLNVPRCALASPVRMLSTTTT